MEKHPLFTDQEIHGNTPQTDPQNQHIPIRIPTGFFVENDKIILKFIWNCKGLRIAEIILKKKKTKVQDSHIPISKLTTKQQLSRHCGTSIRIDIQIYGIEFSPKMNPYIYGQLIFDKEKKKSFQEILLRQLDSHMQKIK